MDAYLQGSLKYKASKHAEQLLKSLDIVEAIQKANCGEILNTLLVLYNELEVKEDFGEHFRLTQRILRYSQPESDSSDQTEGTTPTQD